MAEKDHVPLEHMAAAHERMEPHAVPAPALSSRAVNERAGAQVFFKCESLQKMGAFKFRGAYDALSRLNRDEARRGVLAFSSGNHAQAVALAGKMLGIKTVIVMPRDAPRVKLEGTRSYGAEVVLYGKDQSREKLAAEIAGQRNLVVIPPYNHPHIVAGQGTAAKELIEETGPLDALLVPCGGGAPLSGCPIAAKSLAPRCPVVPLEPAAGDDATRSFYGKKLISIETPDTIADGARTTSLGDLTFPLVLRYGDEMLTVTDSQL